MNLSTRTILQFVAAMTVAIVFAQLALAAVPAPVKAAPVKAPVLARKIMFDARIAFEKKEYASALKLYAKVPQTSEYWVEALEERAWTNVHLKDYDKALGLVKTLMTPPVKYEIGAEPYLLSTHIQLRLCNYSELFNTLKKFKTDIRPRYESLKVLASTGKTEASERAMSRALKLGLSRASAGTDLPNMPRLYYLDKQLTQAVASAQQDLIQARLKALASRDVTETDGILRKLHLVEIEAVQRMTTHLHLADNKKTSDKVDRDMNTLEFPDDENDVWLDELDSYRVNANGCPAMSGGKEGPKS